MITYGGQAFSIQFLKKLLVLYFCWVTKGVERNWGSGRRSVALRKVILSWWERNNQGMSFQNKTWFCFENVKVRKSNNSGLFNYMKMSAWHIFIVTFFLIIDKNILLIRNLQQCLDPWVSVQRCIFFPHFLDKQCRYIP